MDDALPHTEAIALADFMIAAPERVAEDLRRVPARIEERAAAGVRTIVTSSTVDTLAAIAGGHPGAACMHRWLQAHRGEALASCDGVTVFMVRGGG